MAEFRVEISGVDGTIKELNDKTFFKTNQIISGRTLLKTYTVEAKTDAEAEALATDLATLEEPAIKTFEKKIISKNGRLTK